jgi:hypothetical protein
MAGVTSTNWAAEPVDLGKVVAKRDFALPAQRVLEGLRVHVGIAIAIAADPHSHA